MSRTKRLILLIGICFVLLPSLVYAHEGLHEQIAAITAKIKRDPKNASLYLQRGELYRLHRDWSRAAADYLRAERLQPGLKVVELARGKMLFESGKLQRAKLTLDRFLTQQPAHYEGLLTRARVLAKLGARSDAAKDFTHALTMSSTPEPELYLERANVLAGDEQRINEALRGLDEGIDKLGPLVTLQVAAIDLELRSKNYDRALTRLDQIAAQSERKEAWLVRRGEILKLAGRDEEARAAFNAALVAIDSLPAARRQSRAVTALELRAHSGNNVATSPRIGVDQRVELMAIIFRLAGNREYYQGKLQPYVSEIDRHFGPFREHEAIKRRIASFFEDFAGRVETVKSAYDAKRPKVVGVSIENEATDIDPNLTEIVVRFDRPMRKSLPTLGYDLRGPRDRFPEIGKFEFDEQGTSFRISLKLQPAHDYEITLNRNSGGAFASPDGVLLAPYRIHFRTR